VRLIENLSEEANRKWSIGDRIVKWLITSDDLQRSRSCMTPIRLQPNISKTAGDAIATIAITCTIDSLLGASTVGYPSDSLASDYCCRRLQFNRCRWFNCWFYETILLHVSTTLQLLDVQGAGVFNYANIWCIQISSGAQYVWLCYLGYMTCWFSDAPLSYKCFIVSLHSLHRLSSCSKMFFSRPY